jgi:hypothetical protein
MLPVEGPAPPLKPSTSIAYFVPATALKVTRLVATPPEGESSFAAIFVSDETDDPVKTPSIVSKELMAVEMVTVPEDGAVQLHHTDAPPELVEIMFGSPVSLVAPTLEPVTLTDEPLTSVALTNMSFTGAAPRVNAVTKVAVKTTMKERNRLFVR